MTMERFRHNLMSNLGSVALAASHQLNRLTNIVKEKSANITRDGNKKLRSTKYPQPRKTIATPFNDHQELVNKMTNWQRTQWARERRKGKGYQRSLVQHFVDLERPGS